MSNENLKRCVIPGCNKELPEGTTIPICDYHRGEAKEKAEHIGMGVFGIALLALFKAKGPASVRETLPKILRQLKL